MYWDDKTSRWGPPSAGSVDGKGNFAVGYGFCRQENSCSPEPFYEAIYERVAGFRQCKQMCLQNTNCTAIEYYRNTCEIYYTRPPAAAYELNEDGLFDTRRKCYIKIM